MSENFENTIEIDAIDTKYSECRIPDKNRLQYLLASIVQDGIEEPIQGVFKDQKLILLDGFKRLYCAKKLKINMLPFEEIGQDEASGILKLLKISNSKSLHIFEQAKLVKELSTTYGLNIRDIAKRLGRSSSWVSVRLTFLKEITPYVQEQIYKGNFPAHSATHTLRQFTRVNKIKNAEIDQFVKSVSGKGLSTRDVDLLAQGYFRGGEQFKEQIEKGDLTWAISKLKERDKVTPNDLSNLEQQVVKDLEIVAKYMNRLMLKMPSLKTSSKKFMAMAGLLIEGIISRVDPFCVTLRTFGKENNHDQPRKEEGRLDSSSRGNGYQKDCSGPTH